jgi:hypothetical protein
MKVSKEQAKKNWMDAFKKHGGGTKVDPEFTTVDAEALGRELQESFDNIFPDLIKKDKLRKHVIFEPDVFEFYSRLSKERDIPFSVLINTALREFTKARKASPPIERNILKEYLALKKREIELMEELPEDELQEAFMMDRKVVLSK